MKGPCLVFLHIPKTGGTSLSHLILQRFRRGEVFHVRDPRFARGPVYSPHFGPVEEFKELPESRRAAFRLILGHLHYGIHRWIPKPCSYLTMVRDPVQRLVSQLCQYNRMLGSFEIRSDAGDLTSDAGHGPDTPESSLEPAGFSAEIGMEEYLRIMPAAGENHHARFLLNQEEYPNLAPEERERRVFQALCRDFVWVGVQERFEESVVLLNLKLGWIPLPFPRLNVSVSGPGISGFPEGLLERIREVNRLDSAIHAYALERLDHDCARFPEFDKRLRLSRRVNRWVEGTVLLSMLADLLMAVDRRLPGRVRW